MTSPTAPTDREPSRCDACGAAAVFELIFDFNSRDGETFAVCPFCGVETFAVCPFCGVEIPQ